MVSTNSSWIPYAPQNVGLFDIKFLYSCAGRYSLLTMGAEKETTDQVLTYSAQNGYSSGEKTWRKPVEMLWLSWDSGFPPRFPLNRPGKVPGMGPRHSMPQFLMPAATELSNHRSLDWSKVKTLGNHVFYTDKSQRQNNRWGSWKKMVLDIDR